VERGSALTRKLLNFSRRRRADLQDLELASFVEGLRDLFGRLLGEGVRLGLELPERPLWVRADPSDLEQVLINLIANARDAVGPNGQVWLAVELGTGGAWGAIVVRDDGPGIPPEIIPHIFEPFYTTKGIGEGTGLGLAIVYGIVERLGGTVMARNGLDEGAVFTITLPLIEEPVVSDPDIAILPEPEEIQGEGRTVLVVDDDEVIRSLIQEQLRTVGFQVFTAPDGDSALELAASLPQAPELLLTDMRMPGMDGMELVKRLQERQPDLRYLYMTGFGDDIIAAHGSDGPPANLIEKPFRLPTLLAAMEAVMKPPRARRRRQARRTRKPET
jgi:two-component system cell cycle sensor histidine kinase/response regulator CckA